MKAKSRKRLLISSVAMLLVAMLALGTATFAWFTNSTTARADKAKVTVAAPSGLLLYVNEVGDAAPAADADGWSSAFDMSGIADKTLQPVSGNVGASALPSFYAAEVNTAKEVKKIDNASNANVIAVNIYGKLSEAVDSDDTAQAVKLISINNASANKGYPGTVVRGAYYSSTTSGSTTTYTKQAYMHFGSGNSRTVNPVKATATATALASSPVSTNDNYVIPTSATSYVEATAIEATAGFTGGTATVGNVTNGAVTLLGTFYLWVEGQDENCQDVNKTGDHQVIGNTGDITVTFELQS